MHGLIISVLPFILLIVYNICKPITQNVAVPATGVATSGAPFERYFTITANAGGSCTIAITNATTVTVAAGTTITLFVPPGATVTPTYTSAPTWTVFGN